MYSYDNDVDEISFPPISLIAFLCVVVAAVLLRKRMIPRHLGRLSTRTRDQSIHDRFRESIESTAAIVYDDRSVTLWRTEPNSGYYECVFKEFEIRDIKTSQVFAGDGQERKYQTKLEFKYDIVKKGYAISGTRSATGKFFAIEEGFLSFSGMTYWVERASDANSNSYLVIGSFEGSTFLGEWLGTDGTRGKYQLTLRLEIEMAGTDVLELAIGVPA